MHADVVDCLKQIGRLPPTTTSDVIEECRKALKYEELLHRTDSTPAGLILQERLSELKAERDVEARKQVEILK